MIHFVSVCVGTKYDPRYVEILHDMVARNLSQSEVTHWCVTDQAIHPAINRIEANPVLTGWWAKLQLFSPAMPWAEGDRVIYMDLDVCITGRLEDLAQRKGIIQDWNWPCYNSSVMVWDHGEHRAVWSTFTPDVMDAPGAIVPAELLPAGQVNGGDQEWITAVTQRRRESPWPVLPSTWCISFRDVADWPPTDCKVVVFHGATKPADVAEGWAPEVWKVGGFTSVPALDGANVTADFILENIRANVLRDVRWFGGWPHQKKPAVLVAGGPSMRDNVEAIRAHKQRGARIISVNNALGFLRAQGVTPSAHIMLDARPENAAFVADAPAGVRFFIASQCHPSVFAALEGRDVVMWHNAFGSGAELREILAPWWDEGPDQRPCYLIPGGGTVGLRALHLIAASGYRKIHVYGMDSSYEGEVHHAYGQALNDGEETLRVQLRGKEYRCARWMVRQAEEFKTHWADLHRSGVRLIVHGRGLIPDIATALADGVAA